jgi:hypothetical protein
MGWPAQLTCQFCGYSLEGLPKLVCPECGRKHVPREAPPPLEFLAPVARAHVVCSINAMGCLAAALFGKTNARRFMYEGGWDWEGGAMVASLLNFALLLILLWLFPRFHRDWRVTVSVVLSLLPLSCAMFPTVV